MIKLPAIPSARTITWAIHGTGTSILVIASLLVEFLIVEPMRGNSREARAEIDRLEALVARGRIIRTQFEATRDEQKSQVAKQKSLRDRVPEEPMEAEFLSQVAKLAQTHELRLGQYRPGVITQRADYSEVQIEMEGEGTYQGLAHFLDEIPQLPRLASITRLQIQSIPEKPAYSFQLKFSVYFVPMNTKVRS
jgi:Tfp pilus assembly protein PilO